MAFYLFFISGFQHDIGDPECQTVHQDNRCFPADFSNGLMQMNRFFHCSPGLTALLLVSRYPLFHLIIFGQTGGNKYFFIPWHLFSRIQGVFAFTASAPADYK
jgi:hypothetical protein